MAGDWLKMEAATPDKAEVLAITASMGWDDPDLTVGKLFRVWRWFDQQTTDGNAPGVTSALLDRVAGVTGFAISMQKVGWLVISEGGLTLPNFDRHNGKTAKSRALTARRVNDFKAGNAEGNAGSVSGPLPKEEKRKEQKIKVKVKDSSSDFQPDSPPFRLAQHLALRIRENNPKARPPNLQQWARSIDLMMRLDNRGHDEIRAIIDWSQANDFWKANILSADKLREKFDVLTMQSERRNDGGNGNGRRSGDSGSTGKAPEAARNPLGEFGMLTGREALERIAAKRKLQEVPKPPA